MSKKSLKSQFVAAIAMLLVAVMVLSGATFAWFAKNESVQATGMTVNAVADSSLVIKGTKDSVFSSVGTNEVNKTTMKPASSKDGVTFAALADNTKVLSTGSSAAKWTGTGDTFQASDAVKLNSTDEGTFYVETTYTLKSLVKARTVMVSDIVLTAVDTSKSTMMTPIRVSVTIGDGTDTLVFNPKNGTNSDEGKVIDASGTAIALATPTYTTKNTTSFSTTLAADTEYTVTVRIWFEGQDTQCYTNNITTTGYTVDVYFTGKEVTSA